MKILLLLSLTLACGTHAESVCEEVGLCRSQTDDQITACQTEVKALENESRTSGCAAQFDAYFTCADDRYVCTGNTPTFSGCESSRQSLDGCLAGARAGNSCGTLAAQLAACPGAPPPAVTPSVCDATGLCTSRCFLDDVADVCHPQPPELDQFAHCVQQCP